jgi:hypothetical protein
MKRIIIVAGFVALLVTATIAAASYNVQTVNAAANPTPFGSTVIKPSAQCQSTVQGDACTPAPGSSHPSWGGTVQAAANALGGLGSVRANGDKCTQTAAGMAA